MQTNVYKQDVARNNSGRGVYSKGKAFIRKNKVRHSPGVHQVKKNTQVLN